MVLAELVQSSVPSEVLMVLTVKSHLKNHQGASSQQSECISIVIASRGGKKKRGRQTVGRREKDGQIEECEKLFDWKIDLVAETLNRDLKKRYVEIQKKASVFEYSSRLSRPGFEGSLDS